MDYNILEERDSYAIDCIRLWDHDLEKKLIFLGACSLGLGQFNVPKSMIKPILKFLAEERMRKIEFRLEEVNLDLDQLKFRRRNLLKEQQALKRQIKLNEEF